MFEILSSLLKKEMPITDFSPFFRDHFDGFLATNPDSEFMELNNVSFIEDLNEEEVVLRFIIIDDMGYVLTDENYNVIFKADEIFPLFGDDFSYKNPVDLCKKTIKDNFFYSRSTGYKLALDINSLIDLYSPLVTAGLYLVSVDEEIGVYDLNGKVIIKPKYESVSSLSIASNIHKDYSDILLVCSYTENDCTLYDIYDCNGNMLYNELVDIIPISDEISYGNLKDGKAYGLVSRKINQFALIKNNKNNNTQEKAIIDSESLYITYDNQGYPSPLNEADFRPSSKALMGNVNLNSIKKVLTTLAETYKGNYEYSKKELILRIPLWEKIKEIEKPFDINIDLSTPVTKLAISSRVIIAMRRSKITTVEGIINSDDRMFDRFEWRKEEVQAEFSLLKLKLKYWLNNN